MIKIEDDIAYVDIETRKEKPGHFGSVLIDEAVPMPKQARAAKVDKSTQRVIDRYIEAHMKVYGVTCVVRFDKPWIQVRGIDGRFTKARLLEMARQLEYRLG